MAGVGVMAVPILLSLAHSMRKKPIHNAIDQPLHSGERSLVISSTDNRK
jgi:hypothetical protein